MKWMGDNATEPHAHRRDAVPGLPQLRFEKVRCGSLAYVPLCRDRHRRHKVWAAEIHHMCHEVRFGESLQRLEDARATRRGVGRGAPQDVRAAVQRRAVGNCPGRKPPFFAVKRPARPYKTAIENRFTVGNAKAA
jgi:hypothetical protein